MSGAIVLGQFVFDVASVTCVIGLCNVHSGPLMRGRLAVSFMSAVASSPPR